MKISEIFHSIQGEGIHTGRWATFVRFQRCNLKCRWCDSKHTWDFSGGTSIGTSEVVEKILQYQSNSVIFTGGEPLLHQSQIQGICEDLMLSSSIPPWFGIETNGLIRLLPIIEPYVNHVAISPKLRSATPMGYDFDALVWWCFHCTVPSKEFKFVVCDQHDLDDVERLVGQLHLKKSTIPVILQPNGLRRDYPAAARELFDLVQKSSLKNYARVMLQTHKVIWGGMRGV